MISAKRSLKLFVTSAVLIVGIIPFAAHAQDATATAQPGPCDAYSADASTVFQTVSQVTSASSPQTADLASSGIALAKLRLEYQETPAPAGCETTQAQLVQITKLDEDVIFLDLAAQLDSANKATYATFLNSTFLPRFNAFKDSLSSTTAATPEATSEAGVVTCMDTAYQSQVVTAIKTVSGGGLSDAASASATGLKLIQLRYQLEDLVPPAGCESTQTDVVHSLTLFEDTTVAVLGGVGDSANASTYADFVTKEILPREQAMGPQLSAELGMSGTPEATPEATDAS